jgi:hypothetical protein
LEVVLLTQERQLTVAGKYDGLLSLLLVFYGFVGFIGLVSAFAAPWFNWGFLACAVFAAAGLVLVFKHHQSRSIVATNVYGTAQAWYLDARYALLPMAGIVLIVGWKLVEVVGGLFTA